MGVSKVKKSVVFNIEKTQAMCIGHIEMSLVDLAAKALSRPQTA